MKICLRKKIVLQDERLGGWVTHDKAYVVLSVEQYSADEIGFRVSSDDGGMPVVFKASLFEVVDNKLPGSWSVLAVRQNSIDVGPEVFGREGFWERLFDREPLALEEYRVAKERVIDDS